MESGEWKVENAVTPSRWAILHSAFCILHSPVLVEVRTLEALLDTTDAVPATSGADAPEQANGQYLSGMRNTAESTPSPGATDAVPGAQTIAEQRLAALGGAATPAPARPAEPERSSGTGDASATDAVPGAQTANGEPPTGADIAAPADATPTPQTAELLTLAPTVQHLRDIEGLKFDAIAERLELRNRHQAQWLYGQAKRQMAAQRQNGQYEEVMR